MWYRRVLGVAFLLLAATATACRSPRTSPDASKTGAAPDQPVVVIDGKRWVQHHEAAVPLLRPGTRLVGLVPWDTRFRSPPDESEFVRTADGRHVAIRTPDDLRPHVVAITTSDQALDYVRLLRVFRMSPATVPGLSDAPTPERVGAMRRMMEEDLRKDGIDPTPTVAPREGGFTVTRLVVVPEGEFASLVRIRESVGSDASYAAERLDTVRSGPDVARWIWRPL